MISSFRVKKAIFLILQFILLVSKSFCLCFFFLVLMAAFRLFSVRKHLCLLLKFFYNHFHFICTILFTSLEVDSKIILVSLHSHFASDLSLFSAFVLIFLLVHYL